MQTDICILVQDGDLARMLALELAAPDRRVTVAHDSAALPEASLYLIDADAFPDVMPDARTLRLTRAARPAGDTGEWLSLPLSLPTLSARIFEAPPRGLALLAEERAALLDGRRIPLTPREYDLLAALLAAGGEPLSRTELRACAFPADGEGEGVVNVYMHYLRRKLERDGRRVILALRGRGYAIEKEMLT